MVEEDSRQTVEMNEKQQELMFKLSMFEQQIRALQQQLQAVEEGASDLQTLSAGLDELEGATGKEILAPMGRGIFIRAKLLSEELVVDVGGKNFVTKSIKQTKEMIDDQLKKLEEIKTELNDKLASTDSELTRTIEDAQGRED